MLPVEQYEEGDEPLEVEVLDDVVDEGLDLRVLRLGRDVQRLRDLQTLLQVAPAHLQKGRGDIQWCRVIE